MIKTQSKHVDFKKFTNKDGYLKGGVPVEMSKPNESQKDRVQGQRRTDQVNGDRERWRLFLS